MKLTVLGSGSCELNRERSSPSYLLEAGGQTVLLDLGQGGLRRFLQTGRDPRSIDAVLFSHHHPDHMADLIPLLFALNYDPAMVENAFIGLYAHQLAMEVFEQLAAVFGHWLQPDQARLQKTSLEPGREFSLGPVRVTTCPARHMDSSLAFRLEHEGRSLVYLGDSEPSDELAQFAAGAGLMLAHCAGSDQNPKPGHLHPDSAGRLALAAGVGELLLSHFYREVDPALAQASAAGHFNGPVLLARDLSTYQVGKSKPEK